MRLTRLIVTVIAVILLHGAQPIWAEPCANSPFIIGDTLGWPVVSFATAMASAGDVNGDGADDVIITTSSDGSTHHVYVYSGLDGTVLWTLAGAFQGDNFGLGVGAADLNLDGHPDLMIGAPEAYGISNGTAYVFFGDSLPFPKTDGAGGADHIINSSIPGERFGRAVESIGDVNDDGHPDLLVSATQDYEDIPVWVGSGRAYIFSGDTFDTLHSVVGEDSADVFGHTAGAAGDMNNDGVTDFFVGAPYNDGAGTDAGRVYVYSGVDASLLYILSGAPGEHFGASASSAGDVNSDGYADLVVGNHADYGSAVDSAWKVYVFVGGPGPYPISIAASSADHAFTGDEFVTGYGWGTSVCGVGDANQDGYDDIAIGAYEIGYHPYLGHGEVYVYSVRDSVLLNSFSGYTESAGISYSYHLGFGVSMAVAGDHNGDGLFDIVVAATHKMWCAFFECNGPGPGNAFLFRLGNPDGDFVSTDCDNCPDDPNDDQADTDLDEVGDVCDNCPAFANSDQVRPIAASGDVNGDSLQTSADVIYCVNFVFKGGPGPLPCEAAADANCDGSVTSADIVALVGFVFKGGDPPCDVCQAVELDWTCP